MREGRAHWTRPLVQIRSLALGAAHVAAGHSPVACWRAEGAIDGEDHRIDWLLHGDRGARESNVGDGLSPARMKFTAGTIGRSRNGRHWRVGRHVEMEISILVRRLRRGLTPAYGDLRRILPRRL